MSSQGGLKHVPTDPAHLDSKRERRRGAAGRAAVLRRAPSDSDCSGETASLSADSGDRVIRPAPPPVRSGKTRSRRRGSEWEVLEGLKDGQRFDRRPEVFNGYLHKKRKWPLKGWHKRFFVVDGGILVYARSPTDVARGRLHGSVDVGLSVISAKARRRRIDIDADEFIYHLRAKTPDVFRTWLNVLKTHRLYRQHLLTFGARESVPKIHAPLEEIPTAENSSRSTILSFGMSESTTSLECRSEIQTPPILSTPTQPETKKLKAKCFETYTTVRKPIELMALENRCDFNGIPHSLNRLCSITDLPHIDECEKGDRFSDTKTGLKSPNSMEVETGREINSTQLDKIVHQNPTKKSRLLCKYPRSGRTRIIRKNIYPVFNQKHEPNTPIYFFKRFKNYSLLGSPIRGSKKCTNLFRYRNIKEEPPLLRPDAKTMILGKYVLKDRSHLKNAKINHEIQVDVVDKETKSLQSTMTVSEYDRIAEKLIIALFESKNYCTPKSDTPQEVGLTRRYVRHIVKHVFGTPWNDVKTHPIKVLFKSLLEYWLLNTTADGVKQITTHVQCIDKPSLEYFRKNANLFPRPVTIVDKSTQYHILPNDENCKEKENVTQNQKEEPNNNDTDITCKRESRIEDLERLLTNTVYICETVCSSATKETDIQITRQLIDNLSKITRYSSLVDECDSKNSSSTDIRKIQETINHLISESSIPPDVAKEFLGSYLGVLLNDNEFNESDSLKTENSSMASRKYQVLNRDVQIELNKKASRSALGKIEEEQSVEAAMSKSLRVDAGRLYLKEVLENITATLKNHSYPYFKGESTYKIVDSNNQSNAYSDKNSFACQEDIVREEIVKEDKDRNAVVLDLSMYDLENIGMDSDPNAKGTMKVVIKLKEKPTNCEENTRTNLNLDFSGTMKSDKQEDVSDCSRKVVVSSSNFKRSVQNNSLSNDFTDSIQDKDGSNPIAMSSDATSKAFAKLMNASEQISEDYCKKEINLNSRIEVDDTKSQCYILTKYKAKKKRSGTDIDENYSHPDLSIFERPSPKVIDEKFIMLLLENLTLLSKRTPAIYKDISSFYNKMKRKHCKLLEDTHGLGLLGKIYDDEGCTSKSDSDGPETSRPPINLHGDVGIQISERPEMVDESVCTATIERRDIKIQTDANLLVSVDTQVYSSKSSGQPAIALATAGTSYAKETPETLNWIDLITNKNKIKSAIKSIVDKKDSCQNFRFVSKEDIERMQERRNSKRYRKEYFEEIRLLAPSPARKMATKKERKWERDKNVFQIYQSKRFEHTRSNSLSGSNMNFEGPRSDEMKTVYRCLSSPSLSCSGLVSPTAPPLRGPQAGFVSGTPGGRLSGWIIESGGPLETVSRELGQAQLSVQQLQRLLDSLELQHQHHDTDVSLEGASPNVKKDRRKFGLRKKKSNSKCASVELGPQLIDPSSSHMALSALTAPPSPGGGASSAPNSAASLPLACAAARPQSLPGAESLGTAAGPASLTSLTPDQQLREDFVVLAKDLLATLKGVVSTLVCERGRLRAAVDAANGAESQGGGVMAALRTNLSTALQQNSELRSRLSRIHDASDLAEMSSVNNTDTVLRQFQQSLSYSSSCVSASEFFDAEEHDEALKQEELIQPDEAGVIELDGDSSSEAGSLSSEEGSASSDNSEGALLSSDQVTLRLNQNGVESRPASCWTRRTRLPCPRPTPGGPSLWNLLYKNIGKDLSQISMPVTINEPLNMLQRLCEELEYSELLDTASDCKNPIERMALVAAFAVSAYAASAHRAASKPFNPLLAETYECVRDDRGFRFLAEQVSHHPPISACHAESPRWVFWQEARIKTKFWGKSMEFQPTGRVHVKLNTTGDHYSWNKVTTCVHNLFGGQRWVDQYGDMHITCHGTDISCKLNFIKASSWSSSRHEVRGAVTSGSGARLRLQGRWSEALYAGEPPANRCLWRPGAMPPDHELYYGFTRFAMELNELEPGMRELLPHSDTRFRPDQRALEEGDVEAAEQYKHELEQAQRERRRDSPEHTPAWFRKVLDSGEETWVFTGEYWKAREAGFSERGVLRIW